MFSSARYYPITNVTVHRLKGDAGMILMMSRDVQRNSNFWKIHFFGCGGCKVQNANALPVARDSFLKDYAR